MMNKIPTNPELKMVVEKLKIMQGQVHWVAEDPEHHRLAILKDTDKYFEMVYALATAKIEGRLVERDTDQNILCKTCPRIEPMSEEQTEKLAHQELELFSLRRKVGKINEERLIDLDKEVEICVVGGVEGGSLSIDDRRVAGPKPWGGGKITKRWTTPIRYILEAFPDILKRLEP
jgi:hypothetical protein